MVPTAAVAPLLRRGLISDFGEEFQTPGAGNLPRILFKWEHEVEYAEFNSVDGALAAVNMLEQWREEEPDSYYRPNISRPGRGPQRCERAGCSELIIHHPKGGGRKRFCSQVCLNAEYMAKKNGRKRVDGPRGKLRRMVCAKGHDMHGDNLRQAPRGDGTMRRWCHQCKIERQRAYRKRLATQAQ